MESILCGQRVREEQQNINRSVNNSTLSVDNNVERTLEAVIPLLNMYVNSIVELDQEVPVVNNLICHGYHLNEVKLSNIERIVMEIQQKLLQKPTIMNNKSNSNIEVAKTIEMVNTVKIVEADKNIPVVKHP